MPNENQHDMSFSNSPVMIALPQLAKTVPPLPACLNAIHEGLILTNWLESTRAFVDNLRSM